MAVKEDIIAQIQAAADATDLPRMRMALGATGSYVVVGGERQRTGRTWESNPNDGGDSPPVVQLEGLASYLDTYRAKINELVAGYTQLKADYDSSTVPTSAASITPLP